MRRTASFALAFLVTTFLLPTEVSAVEVFQRYSGSDRYATAVDASSRTWPPDSVDTVILASGTSTVDALASSYLAGAHDAPILLTERDRIPDATLAEIERLNPSTILLAGGAAVIGQPVRDRLAGYTLLGLGGDDRYETAAAMARQIEEPRPERVFVASGLADAAAAGVLAAATMTPVLLTPSADAAPAALDFIAENPGIEVVVIGGERAVTPQVANRLGAVRRIQGADRYATSVEIARYGVDELGLRDSQVGLADGRGSFADALAAAPVLGRAQAPLILTGGELGPAAASYLQSSNVTGGFVFGGPNAVGDGVVQAATTALTSVVKPPVAAAADYQLGGAYTPDPAVGIVTRDREERPVADLYNICYVNGFQTQPGEAEFWRTEHPELLLTVDGEPVEDAGWPGEYLLDTRTASKRQALAAIVGGWFDGCAADGFDAVEPDNLDTWTRSDGLLTREGNLAFAELLADRAHAAGLAIAQKNAAELTAAEVRDVGFDFAVTESCQVYAECDAYTDLYGDHVIEIEYTDDGEQYFTAACAARGGEVSVLLRDRDVVPKGAPGYRYEWC